MTQVVFYHLTRRGLDETVEGLLIRAVGQGWRVMVRCTGTKPMRLACT